MSLSIYSSEVGEEYRIALQKLIEHRLEERLVRNEVSTASPVIEPISNPKVVTTTGVTGFRAEISLDRFRQNRLTTSWLALDPQDPSPFPFKPKVGRMGPYPVICSWFGIGDLISTCI